MSHVHEDTIDIKCPHGILSPTGKADKAKELALLKEIISAICALLNSNGGKVVLHIKDIPKGQLPSTQKMPVIRKLEQSMIAISGIHQIVGNINFKEVKEGIVIYVKKANSLITINFNLYLPSETQVVQAPSLEPLENIKDIISMKREVISKASHLGSHCKTFHRDKHCGFPESKFVQLKNVKPDRSKRTRLADRVTGKGNKFCCYVSAFANHQGGHIYYGIKDDGIVEGELVSSGEDKIKITKKVEKTINKMSWPELIGQPKRGVQWEIFFQPVVDEDNNVIPSTFVIVIYIAPCLGGVFTEEPECYEMVEGNVQKMSFASWRRNMQPTEIVQRKIPCTLQRITWGSTGIRNICTRADQELTQRMNNGIPIAAISTKLKHQFPKHIEVKLVVLSKEVMVGYRSCCFIKAKRLLKKYDALLEKATESDIFDAIRAYIEVALHRARGDVKALKKILVNALVKAEKIVPGLITAAIYLLAATVVSLFRDKENDLGYSADVLSTLALQHLQYVQDSPVVRADMEQKIHITLALSYLGSNISGVLTKPQVDRKSLEKAKSSVNAVNISINEGNPMNRYRELQFNLVQSILYYRYSQIQPDRDESFLHQAFFFTKKAECLASMYHFEEMLKYARTCKALCTEGLVRTHFKHYICYTKSMLVESGSASCDDNAIFPHVAKNL